MTNGPRKRRHRMTDPAPPGGAVYQHNPHNVAGSFFVAAGLNIGAGLITDSTGTEYPGLILQVLTPDGPAGLPVVLPAESSDLDSLMDTMFKAVTAVKQLHDDPLAREAARAALRDAETINLVGPDEEPGT